MFHLPPEDRLRAWRDFRKTLDLLPVNEAIHSTVDFWQKCPFAPYYLDSAESDLWPNPWDLIIENYYCDLAKSLGMLYTLYFTEHGKNLEIELRIYIDPISRHEYNLVFFDGGKYILNFQDGEVVEIGSINKNLVLKYCYDNTDLKLEEY
ncbi:MAG TPA: hypothetical protein VFM18_17300 [Methanosarcina sp.]|nr:hypothetical protein [Methanosarcina sp.]